MSKSIKTSRGFIGETLAIFGAAAAASAAVRAHRKPSKQTLETLGINSDAFDKVGL